MRMRTGDSVAYLVAGGLYGIFGRARAGFVSVAYRLARLSLPKSSVLVVLASVFYLA